MSEELLQRGLDKKPEKIGKWDFYNIGSTTVKSLKEYGILRKIDYGNVESKKIDAIITHNKNVIAVIEYKKPAEFRTQKQKQQAIDQEIEVAKKIGSKILIATDTLESVWINSLNGERIKDEDGKIITTNFDYSNEKIVPLIEKILYSINETNSHLKPKRLVNPTDLAKQIWQDVWSVSGATPENCLYTFVELFIFKYLSDLGVLKGAYSFNHLMESYEVNSDEEVLEIYASTVRRQIKDLFPINPIDNTTIINGTIFVSKDQKAVKGYSGVFKKILTKFENYGKLEYIDHDFKSKLFESFLKESISKKNWGQFFTPLKVVKAMVQMAKSEIKDNIKICDPACGVGKFLLEPVVNDLDYFYKIENNKIVPKIKLYGFDKGFDKDEQKTIILAKANMLIYFSDLIKDNPNLTKEFALLFNDSFTLKTNSILGTLSDPMTEEYDLILTNPPYVTSGSSNLKEEIKKDSTLTNHYKINALGVEGLFIEWIIRALKPNGKAFIVIPDGIFNRQNDKNLRQFILDECLIDGIISLPIKTFFTTPKKTYILCITKKADKNSTQIDPVFTYLVSEIGESRDIYRFDIDQNDLEEAVILFNQFKGAKNFFKTVDNRCKIQPIEKFDPQTHWSVDRWWSKEEQISLGIIDENDVVDVNEFSEIVSEVSETLNELSILLKEVAEKKKTISGFEEVELSDEEYFNLFIGKRVVKRDIINISGNKPIYSANVKVPIGFHDQSNISNFNNNFVLWGIDGNFEFNVIPKNQPFVSTDHCGAIRILKDQILPEYLMIQLEKVKHKYGFDRGLRASLENMRNVSIEIPFKTNGNIDIDKQREIISKYEYVFGVKKKVFNYKQKIKSLNVSVASLIVDSKFDNVEISSILDSPPTNSGLKKKDVSLVSMHKNTVPVYSATMVENAIFGWVSEDSKWKKYENVLTWNKDGSAGYVFYRKNRFVPYEKVKLLKIKEEHNSDLSYHYLKYVIQNRLFEEGFGFSVKCSMDKVLKLKIPIPIGNDGMFDNNRQNEIASVYEDIDEIRQSILDELEKILNIDIHFN